MVNKHVSDLLCGKQSGPFFVIDGWRIYLRTEKNGKFRLVPAHLPSTLAPKKNPGQPTGIRLCRDGSATFTDPKTGLTYPSLNATVPKACSTIRFPEPKDIAVIPLVADYAAVADWASAFRQLALRRRDWHLATYLLATGQLKCSDGEWHTVNAFSAQRRSASSTSLTLEGRRALPTSPAYPCSTAGPV